MSKKFRQNLLLFLSFSIFSRGLFLNRKLTSFDFDLFAYPFYIFLFVLLIILNQLRHIFLFRMIIIFSVLFVISYSSTNYPIDQFIKITLPFIIVTTSSYSLLFNSLESFFKQYIRISLIVSVIGFIQVALKLINIRIFSRYSFIDLHSIVTEPSHYVVVILPAAVYCYLKNHKKKFWILFASLILTFKLTAIFSVVIMYLIIHRKWQHILLYVPLFLSTTYVISNNLDYSFRVFNVINYFLGKDVSHIIHGTPLSFLANLEVAFFSASEHFLGNGIGGHSYGFDEYFKNNEWLARSDYQFGINKNSAHSLSIRILSEFGFFGFFGIIWIFIAAYFKAKKDDTTLIIYYSILSHFIAKSIKLGGYIDFGTPIFFSILLLILFKSNFKYKFNVKEKD